VSETIQDPEVLEGHHLELRSVRGATTDVHSAVRTAVQATSWEGNTAVRVKAGIHDAQAAIVRANNELDVALDEIRAHINWTTAQRAELRNLELHVNQWISQFYARSPEEQDASPIKPRQLGNLPAHYSTAWRGVYSRLRHAGVL
jgi:hypothetical protein